MKRNMKNHKEKSMKYQIIRFFFFSHFGEIKKSFLISSEYPEVIFYLLIKHHLIFPPPHKNGNNPFCYLIAV